MSFEELPPLSPSASKVDPTRVYISPYKTPGLNSPASKPGIKVTIGKAVFDRLGWMEGQQIAALWGSDNDSGKIRLKAIRSTAPGWNMSIAKSGYMTVRIRRLPDDVTPPTAQNVAVLAVEGQSADTGENFLTIEIPPAAVSLDQ